MATGYSRSLLGGSDSYREYSRSIAGCSNSYRGSFYMGSDETFDYTCSPCKKGNNGLVEAAFYCLTCDAFFCQACQEFHNSFKVNKIHPVYCRDQMDKWNRQARSTMISTETTGETIKEKADKLRVSGDGLKGLILGQNTNKAAPVYGRDQMDKWNKQARSTIMSTETTGETIKEKADKLRVSGDGLKGLILGQNTNKAAPGRPYHPKVVDPKKVTIIGGWQHFMDTNERVSLVVGERTSLPFDISKAGPGTLRAEVKGPSRSVKVDIDLHTVGRASVEFIPLEEGNHFIHLFWCDIPLVNSPFLGYAVTRVADASKLILTGRGLKEAVVREEAEFVIDGSQTGRGNPDVVLSGVRAEVNVKTVPIGNGKFRCSYIAMVPGAYLLHITWNGRQLRGSPYKVNVIGAFYPNRVVVSGEGLKGGILGESQNVLIDTRKAGPGELTAYCMGPHQVAYCELEDARDGTFRLSVKAQEAGRHVMQIKYGGEHVQGSPFIFKVTSQPDASKVIVTGPGVEDGLLTTYVSRFIVETRGAGAGQLTVRIRGPKGGFQVEMYRDSKRDRTILCRYDPTECGLYIISVKWSGVDVPGSPFQIHILDTQEELEQVLNDVSYSIGTHSRRGSDGSQSTPRLEAQPKMVYSQWRDQI